MKTLMEARIGVVAIAMLAAGCSGLLQKNGGLVSRDANTGLVVPNTDPDTGLAFHGTATLPTLNEVVDRIENSLIGASGTKIVNRNTGGSNFQRAITSARDNFFESRDPVYVSSSGVLAALQVAHGACATLTTGTTGTLFTQFQVNTGQTIAQNRTALVNMGERLISNTTGLTAQVDPNLIALVRNLFDAQVTELAGVTPPTGTNATQAAAVSVCTTALMAGAFGIGS